MELITLGGVVALWFIGSMVTQHRELSREAGKRIGLVAGVIAGGTLINYDLPLTTTVFYAFVAAVAVTGVTWIVLPALDVIVGPPLRMLVGLVQTVRSAIHLWTFRRLINAFADRTKAMQEATAERRASRPPPPPPATKAERAKAKYESMIEWLSGSGLDRNELKAARAKARQNYLKDIGENL
jgi:hypothetical protein